MLLGSAYCASALLIAPRLCLLRLGSSYCASALLIAPRLCLLLLGSAYCASALLIAPRFRRLGAKLKINALFPRHSGRSVRPECLGRSVSRRFRPFGATRAGPVHGRCRARPREEPRPPGRSLRPVSAESCTARTPPGSFQPPRLSARSTRHAAWRAVHYPAARGPGPRAGPAGTRHAAWRAVSRPCWAGVDQGDVSRVGAGETRSARGCSGAAEWSASPTPTAAAADPAASEESAGGKRRRTRTRPGRGPADCRRATAAARGPLLCHGVVRLLGGGVQAHTCCGMESCEAGQAGQTGQAKILALDET